MAITSIAELRASAPPQFRSLSEEDLLRRYAENAGVSFDSVANYFGIKPRGTLAEMGRQFAGGTVVDVPRMGGQGLKYFSTPGSDVYEFGQGLVSGAEGREALYAPDDRGRGLVGRALTMGARALPAVVPIIGASLIPGVGEVAAPAAAAALFGPSSAQDTYEKLRSQGVSNEDALVAARSVGLIQGVGEAAGTAVGARFLKAAGPLFGRTGGTAEQVAQRMTDTGVVRPALTEFGKQMVIQPGTEVLQDVGSSIVERAVGAKPENLWEIAKDSAMGAAGLTTILGPLSIFGHRARAQRAENLKDALYGENTPLDVRTAAIDIVRNEAARQGVKPENVEPWFDQQLQMEDARNAELARRAALYEEQRSKQLVGLVAEQRGVTEQDLMTPGITSASLIDKTMGIGRETPKGYAEQFAAAYNEPSGRRVIDPKTGLERELTAGEAQLLNAGLASEIDLTGAAPKATVTAEAQKAGITAPTEEQKKEEAAPVTVDENRAFFRDELGVLYTPRGLQLLNYIKAANLDPKAAELAPVWSAAATGVTRESQLDKLKGEVDKLIIASKQTAAGITPTVSKSTPSQRAADAAAAAAAENQARTAEKDAAQFKALQDLAARIGRIPTRGEIMGQLVIPREKATELLNRLTTEAGTQTAAAETQAATVEPAVSETTPQTVTAPDLAATAAPAAVVETTAAPAATAPATPEPVISRKGKKRVVTPATPAAAYVAPESQETTVATAEAPQDVGLSEENQRDIAELTGSLETAQEEQGAEAPVGRDIDEAVKAQIIADRFAASKSKDPARDAEILDAYISAVQKAPDKSATAIQTAIGAKYGIGSQAVRKIGNLTPLVEAGIKQGFTAEQVRAAFGIPDTTKGGPTEIGALESELATIRKDLKTVPSEKKGALIAKAASLAEQIQKLETQADVAEKESFAQAVQETTGGAIEGETAGMGFDDARLWSQPENQLEALSQALVNISNKEQDLQELLNEYTEQNLPDAVAAVQTQIQKVQAEFQQALANIKAAEDKAKGKKNAVQESGATTVSVQSGTTGGKGVRKQNTEGQKAAGKGQAQTQEVTKTPAEQWAALSAQAAQSNIQLPAYESLTSAQRNRFDDLARRGEATLASVSNSIVKASDVKTVSPKGAAERTDGEAAPSVKFGKGGLAKNPYSVKELVQDLRDFIRVDTLGRNLIVVEKVEDLIDSTNPEFQQVGEALRNKGAFGVAKSGRAYLIANRINKGEGRAKFMHEVGGHLGLENLLTPKAYKELVDQVKGWEKRNDNSIESVVAKKARARLEAANTPNEDVDAELIAYTLEEAILAGVDPTATKLKGGSELRSWFRTVWAAFKNAARKLGFKRDLNAQDLVNLAFGAARLEINGTWHGTAASFRNFRDKFINTGEGAQYFGWGQYVAQFVTIGRRYLKDDVARKTTPAEVLYEGESVKKLYDKLDADYWKNPEARNPNFTPKPTLDYIKYLSFKELMLSFELYDRYPTQFPDPVANALEDLDTLAKSDTRTRQNYTQAKNWLSENSDKFTFTKQNAPAGALLRVDTLVSPSTSLNLDNDLVDQPPAVVKVMQDIFSRSGLDVIDLEDLDMKLSDIIEIGRDVNNWTDLKGRDFIGTDESDPGILAKLLQTAITVTDPDTLNAMKEGRYHKAASLYLRSRGLSGIQFLDYESRKQKPLILEAMKRTDAYKKMADRALEAFEKDDSAENAAWLVKALEDQRNNLKEVNKLQDLTYNLIAFNERDLQRVASLVGGDSNNMRFGVNSPTQSQIQKAIAQLPKAAQQPVRNSMAALTQDVPGKLLDRVVFTGDLVKRAQAAGITSAGKFERLINASKTEAREYERAVEKIADMYALVPQDERGSGPKSVSRFLFDSTRTLKWGYGQTADSDMTARFDKLSTPSQELVKAIFKHGADVLAQKKKVVLEAASSEYDAMIKVAQDAVAVQTTADDVKKAQETLDALKKEKQATLKRFNTLFAIREGKPFAPIKRTGNYVVIAKSQEYRNAEAAKDKKKLEELEQDGDHYHVTFKDSKAEARTLEAQLVEQGFFGGPDAVKVRERDQLVDEMYGNTSALRELTKLRSRVDKASEDGDKSATKLVNIINQMYLEALAEGSARKSEMKRRGVDGEVDMLQSFAQQGRADAQFMAAVKYNPQIQDALRAMRSESKSGDATRKSELLNELGKRYLESLDYAPKPWLDKLTRMSSVYFLATSPSYYLQNLTQPWVMSVPAMAGRHNYLVASASLFKAYTELGGVMKSAKLLKQQFDFDKVPADVRDAIKELVNRGKIDIGLDTEIGQFRVEGEGVVREKINAADKALRLAVQKVESINRLSTAIAAYRMELAKTKSKEAALEYADRILTETHGDYTAFNAPRIFNSSVGKVALQFRKFQLIQLGFYAKLLKDALQGKDRAVALKTLGYSLGHTAMLAGVTGLPGYMAISAVLGMLFGDDDKDFDTTQELRKAIGDEQLANLILKGAPTLVGADISGKVGAGSMLSLIPFNNADLSTKAGMAEAFGTLIGGASLGMTTRMADGLLQMFNGSWYKGLEQLMPKGVGDAMKAYRLYNDGMTKRNNDVILSADDVGEVSALWQAIGVSPVKTSVVYEQQRAFKAQTDKLTARTTQIKQDYAKAYRDKDSEDMAAARAEWNQLQDTRRSLGYPRQPMSELLKAPMEQRKREKATVEGIQYTAGTKRAARQFVTEE